MLLKMRVVVNGSITVNEMHRMSLTKIIAVFIFLLFIIFLIFFIFFSNQPLIHFQTYLEVKNTGGFASLTPSNFSFLQPSPRFPKAFYVLVARSS